MTAEETEDVPLAPEAYLKGLREQFPDIRPYGEDDWDWTWADDGMEMLEAGDYGMAELKFQQLIVSQPQHPDGYEGLALVYQRLRHWRQAVMLIDEALRLARILFEKGHIDLVVLRELQAEHRDIHDQAARDAAE